MGRVLIGKVHSHPIIIPERRSTEIITLDFTGMSSILRMATYQKSFDTVVIIRSVSIPNTCWTGRRH